MPECSASQAESASNGAVLNSAPLSLTLPHSAPSEKPGNPRGTATAGAPRGHAQEWLKAQRAGCAALVAQFEGKALTGTDSTMLWGAGGSFSRRGKEQGALRFGGVGP